MEQQQSDPLISKLTLIVSLVFLFIFSPLTAVESNAQSMAQHEDIGLGVMLGDPSGISYKNWFNSKNAVDAAVGWSLRRSGSIYFHVDYLWHNYDLFQDIDSDFEVEQGLVGFYYGIGGRLILNGNSSLGARIPVGVNYMFEDHPLELFIEVVPILDIIPDTEPDLGGALGVRYYF